MDIKNKLSKILKKYRSEHKLSQEKMAERCDISTRYYQDLDREKKIPRLDTAVKIFSNLGLSLDLLLADNLPTEESSKEESL